MLQHFLLIMLGELGDLSILLLTLYPEIEV